MKLGTLRTWMLLAAASLAHAHFVFVVPDGANARVFISETLAPDGMVGTQLVRGAKLTLRAAGGKELPLTLVQAADAYRVALSGEGTRVIHGLADLGLSQSGSTKPYLLLYHPKAILGDAFDGKSVVGGDVPVEIVPTGKPGTVILQLLAHGKPHADGEITVILPDGSQKKLKTDEMGRTEALASAGRYGAWARFWEPGTGERDGKTYDQVRHYATLVFDAGDGATAGITATRFATLPEAASSFGSVVDDGWLYVYGGHIAPTHVYSTEAVSGRFQRLRLSGKPEWEQLPGGPGLQGMNLAVHRGKIYRIGGMSPHNRPGTPADNYSVADCARFDPATGKWEALPPMPVPRSSHDVVVVGDRLIVTGGWDLKGGAAPEWMDTLAVLDLNAKPLAWKTLKQPFKRRALMAAAFDGKMYVIGGFDDQNRIVREVSIYDPETDTWSEGPKIPEGPGLAFAPAVGVHEGNLYVSVSDGTLLRLNRARQEWEKVGSSTPRLAHRMASWDKSVLVIGGADEGKNSDLIEASPVGQ